MSLKPSRTIRHYGLDWDADQDLLEMEFHMIRHGGRWMENGVEVGLGLFHHYKRVQELLWPEAKIWHRWNIMQLEAYLHHRIIGEIGPASSGKTNSAATNLLTDYYVYPDCTTGLVSSTEREMLEMRVWGEIKKFHSLAKEQYPWLPGILIESKQRIVTDEKSESDGRDFRNGLCGVPCKRGGEYVGLGSFAGIKNKRVRLIADEASLMPQIYVEAISNLNKNPDFKCVALGNPKSTTDALGRICEPDESLGGWEGGIDQTGKSKTWKTRFAEGICLQLVGSDSPNSDGKLGIDLINQKQIDADIKFYGRDSLQFTMMNEGRMPRGEGSRRIVTRQICENGHALEPVFWRGSPLTKIGFLDAAFGNVGGDRCVFGELNFGTDIRGIQTMFLVETVIVPVSVRNKDETPEDQITLFVKMQCEQRDIPPQNFFYDAGMRTSLVMSFSRIWTPQVCSIDSMGPATERPVDNTLFITEKNGKQRLKTCREHYANFVTEMWFSVRYVVEAGQFRGLTEDVMYEGTSREWGMVGANKIQAEPKDLMKKRMGRSPDLFDGLAYGVEGARQRGFRIARLVNASYEQQDESWKEDLRAKHRDFKQTYELTYD